VTLSDELHDHLRHAYGWGRGEHCAFCGSVSIDKPLNRSTYHRALQEVAKRLGIRVSAHSARKLYAQRVYQATGDITAVQEALHHRYITTTCTYLDIDINNLITSALP